MPTHKSAVKRLKQSKKLHVHNVSTKSNLKTLSHKFNELIANNKIEEAKKLMPAISSSFDKASKRGILHDNTASRKKSRMQSRLNKAATK